MRLLYTLQAVSDVMAAHTVAYFSYEHRTYPHFDPREVCTALMAWTIAVLSGLSLCLVDFRSFVPRQPRTG